MKRPISTRTITCPRRIRASSRSTCPNTPPKRLVDCFISSALILRTLHFTPIPLIFTHSIPFLTDHVGEAPVCDHELYGDGCRLSHDRSRCCGLGRRSRRTWRRARILTGKNPRLLIRYAVGGTKKRIQACIPAKGHSRRCSWRRTYTFSRLTHSKLFFIQIKFYFFLSCSASKEILYCLCNILTS